LHFYLLGFLIFYKLLFNSIYTILNFILYNVLLIIVPVKSVNDFYDSK